MNIDDMEGLDEEARKKIEELQKVVHTNNTEESARAKLDIGMVLAQNNNIEDALSVWKDIERTDNPNAYAYAQLNIGIAFERYRDTRNALSAWSNIKRVDDPNAYAHAQLNSGVASDKEGNIHAALVAWKNINREDDLEIYSQAQYNLGLILYREGNEESALLLLEVIDRSDSPHIYAQSRYLAAQILKEQGKYERALRHLCDIKDSDDSRVYTQAELVIASLMKGMDSYIGFLEALYRVKREGNAIHYAFAQLLIGSDFRNKGNTKEAIEIWNNILPTDDLKIYRSAQYEIGKLLICDHESKKYADTKNAFTNAESSYPYEAYCYKKICDLLLDSKLEAVGEKELQLLEKTLEIVEILQLEFGQYSNEEKFPERKLAHYTSTDTANLLLDSNEEKSLPSAFRLNTINNVNDPSEGQLLLNYLKGIKEKSFHSPDFDEKLHAFIGCFTFNHDSLNQFRLYGKQDHKEASGVSLVFKKEFFQSSNLSGGLSFLSIGSEVQRSNNDLVINSIDKASIARKKASEKTSLSKKPVMRCVYLDPTSDYIHLAQRNRLTFFREFGDEKIEIKMPDGIKEINWADIEWEKYKFELRRKTKDFEKAFKELKGIYKDLISKISILKNVESNILSSVETLSNEILLPLKYLIKHSAFQEEQECRMVYVTSINAPEVVMQHKKFLYIEYEADVRHNLDKIYIAPAATEYRLYLAWLLRNSDVKIELSNNPYRQT